MYYKLTLDDGNYNRLSFDFETMNELSSFLEMVFDSTAKKLKATIEVMTEESEEENDI